MRLRYYNDQSHSGGIVIMLTVYLYNYIVIAEEHTAIMLSRGKSTG